MNYKEKYFEFHIKDNLEQVLLKLDNPIMMNTIKKRDKEHILKTLELMKEQLNAIEVIDND